MLTGRMLRLPSLLVCRIQINGFRARREMTFGRGEAHLPSRQVTGTVHPFRCAEAAWRGVPGCFAPTVLCWYWHDRRAGRRLDHSRLAPGSDRLARTP